MGDRPDPHEFILYELKNLREDYFSQAKRDNEIDADERRVLSRIDGLKEFTSTTKARFHTARLIEKGADPSDYLNQIAAGANLKVISLETERNKRKIIQFPGTEANELG